MPLSAGGKVRLRAGQLEVYLPLVLLLVVASGQFVRSHFGAASRWKGGGYGMFSTIDSGGSRSVEVLVHSRDGNVYSLSRAALTRLLGRAGYRLVRNNADRSNVSHALSRVCEASLVEVPPRRVGPRLVASEAEVACHVPGGSYVSGGVLPVRERWAAVAEGDRFEGHGILVERVILIVSAVELSLEPVLLHRRQIVFAELRVANGDDQPGRLVYRFVGP